MPHVCTVFDEEPQRDVLTYRTDIPGPEIVGLMDRFEPAYPEPAFSSLGPPTALVVTRSAERAEPSFRALRDGGWAVLICGGPGQGRCPLMSRERCQLREAADIAVVFIDGSSTRPALGSIPRLRCAADPSSPGVLVLEGRADAPAYLGSTATVGERRGSRAIVQAITTVLGESGRGRSTETGEGETSGQRSRTER